MKRLILAIVLSAGMAGAAGIEGRWTSEIAARAASKPGKKGGAAKATLITFNLKSSGGELAGTVSAGAGKRSTAMQVQNGRMEGDSFSFTTVQKSKKGEVKWSWRGSVKGDEMTGTRTREGARRGQSFTAKRAG